VLFRSRSGRRQQCRATCFVVVGSVGCGFLLCHCTARVLQRLDGNAVSNRLKRARLAHGARCHLKDMLEVGLVTYRFSFAYALLLASMRLGCGALFALFCEFCHAFIRRDEAASPSRLRCFNGRSNRPPCESSKYARWGGRRTNCREAVGLARDRRAARHEMCKLQCGTCDRGCCASLRGRGSRSRFRLL
jgi:hypothetical protein